MIDVKKVLAKLLNTTMHSLTFTASSDANGYFQCPTSLNGTTPMWAEVENATTEDHPYILSQPTRQNNFGLRFLAWNETVRYASTTKTITVWYIKRGGGYFLALFSAIERWWRYGRCEENSRQDSCNHKETNKNRALQVGLFKRSFCRWTADIQRKSIKLIKSGVRSGRVYLRLLGTVYVSRLGWRDLSGKPGCCYNQHFYGDSEKRNVKRISTGNSTLCAERFGIALFQNGGGWRKC